jgi:hypothetical protein
MATALYSNAGAKYGRTHEMNFDYTNLTLFSRPSSFISAQSTWIDRMFWAENGH